jgi:hypothetical protein
MLQEHVMRPDGVRIEISLAARGRYRLACLAQGELLVAYWGDGARHRRRVRGRESAYEFRSVEQLRYDFERDAEDARRQG